MIFLFPILSLANIQLTAYSDGSSTLQTGFFVNLLIGSRQIPFNFTLASEYQYIWIPGPDCQNCGDSHFDCKNSCRQTDIFLNTTVIFTQFRGSQIGGYLCYDTFFLGENKIQLPFILGTINYLHDWSKLKERGILGLGKGQFSLLNYLNQDLRQVSMPLSQNWKHSRIIFGQYNLNGVSTYDLLKEKRWEIDLKNFIMAQTMISQFSGNIAFQLSSEQIQFEKKIFDIFQEKYLNNQYCFKAKKKTQFSSDKYLCSCDGGPPKILPDLTFVMKSHAYEMRPSEYVLPNFLDQNGISYCRLGIQKGEKEDLITVGQRFAQKFTLVLEADGKTLGIHNDTIFSIWMIMDKVILISGIVASTLILLFIVYSILRRRKRKRIKRKLEGSSGLTKWKDKPKDPMVLTAIISQNKSQISYSGIDLVNDV